MTVSELSCERLWLFDCGGVAIISLVRGATRLAVSGHRFTYNFYFMLLWGKCLLKLNDDEGGFTPSFLVRTAATPSRKTLNFNKVASTSYLQ